MDLKSYWSRFWDKAIADRRAELLEERVKRDLGLSPKTHEYCEAQEEPGSREVYELEEKSPEELYARAVKRIGFRSEAHKSPPGKLSPEEAYTRAKEIYDEAGEIYAQAKGLYLWARRKLGLEGKTE